jgi:hypothetical protein
LNERADRLCASSPSIKSRAYKLYGWCEGVSLVENSSPEFLRLSSVIVLLDCRARLTNCTRYFLFFPISHHLSMHSSVNSYMMNTLFTLFDLGAHAFWKWTSYTKKSDLMRLVLQGPGCSNIC